MNKLIYLLLSLILPASAFALTQNELLYFNGTNFSGTSSPTIGYITATSTTATSTFGNGINITNGCFSVSGSCLEIGGVGTSEAPYFTATDSTATSTFYGPVFIDGLLQVGELYDETLLTDGYNIAVRKDIDGYSNIELGNFSLGEFASSDYVLTNASSSEDGYYASFSLGGTRYNDPDFGLLGIANSATVYSNFPNGAMQIASIGAGGYVQIIAGSTSTEPTRFTSTGAVGIGSTSPSARLVVTNPLSTRTAVFEDSTPDATPTVIDASGNFTSGGTITSTGLLTASADIALTGGDIYIASGNNRFLAEDSLYIGADYLNNDTDSSGGQGIFFTKNTGIGVAVSGFNTLAVFKESNQFSFGTSTTNATFTVVATSTSATTTIEFGDRYTSASDVCFNTKNTAGGSISFYFVGTTLVVENNRCN